MKPKTQIPEWTEMMRLFEERWEAEREYQQAAQKLDTAIERYDNSVEVYLAAVRKITAVQP